MSFFGSRSGRSNPSAADVEQVLDPQARLLLEAFEVPALRRSSEYAAGGGLRLGTLARCLVGDEEAIRPLAEKLVAQGYLRRAPATTHDSPEGSMYGATEASALVYSRSEDGIVAIAGPLDVTLYTRPGCHLCEEAKKEMGPLLNKAGARLREVNIDADAVLRERYDFDVPVVLLGSRKIAKHYVNMEQFRRQLEEAGPGGRQG